MEGFIDKNEKQITFAKKTEPNQPNRFPFFSGSVISNSSHLEKEGKLITLS